jgi:hypothetical protein
LDVGIRIRSEQLKKATVEVKAEVSTQNLQKAKSLAQSEKDRLRL